MWSNLFINLIYIIDEKRVSVRRWGVSVSGWGVFVLGWGWGLCPGVGGLCPGGVSVRETPPTETPPYGNVRAIRILLECILDFFDHSCDTFHFGCFSPVTKQIPWVSLLILAKNSFSCLANLWWNARYSPYHFTFILFPILLVLIGACLSCVLLTFLLKSVG